MRTIGQGGRSQLPAVGDAPHTKSRRMHLILYVAHMVTPSICSSAFSRHNRSQGHECCICRVHANHAAATLCAAGAACAQDEGEVCAFALSLFIPNAMRDPWSLLLDQQPRPPPIPEVSCRFMGATHVPAHENASKEFMVLLTMPVPQLGLGGRDRGPGVAGGGGGGDSDTVKVGEVPRTSALELSYERFCLDFMEPNRPVILQVIVYCCQADRP